ncbi:IQ motif, EF-hand binding site [Sesbania bispinosa]|nr:IQ motif, EF-hand binding site [Sesbania bispinosa]
MDSYPYQRNQIPFSHCYHPGIEAVPPQIRADPSKPPFSYEQFWPYAGSYGHPIPTHFCCGHNNFPGYYSYRPSYPHSPAPSPIYCSGGCPAYAEPNFVPYSPQPHYSMELPRYEYDKYMPRDHHCCGCPNHPCNQKEEKSVKIEEHEPDAGKKVNDAVVPIQLRNYPYPLIWIPPEYTSNRQLKNPTTAEVGEQLDNMSYDRTPNADAQPAQEPRAWNEWLPFYMKGAPNMVHYGDGVKSQNYETDNKRRESEDGRLNQKHQREHKKSELPFPIIWLPYYNKQEEGEKTNNQDRTSTPKCIEEAPHTFKSVPVKFYVDEGVTNGTRSNQTESIDTSASDVTEKVTNERSIPVKQMESHQDKNNPEGNHKREEMDVPVNQKEENVTKEGSHTSGKRQPTSPPKASKLPPVCLRVDPLPRKKNGNGSSRSPTPPASKEHSQTTAGEASKTPPCGMNNKAQPNLKLQNAPNTNEKVKPEERIIQVSENKTSENKGAESKDESQSQMSIPSEVSTGTKESYTDGDKCKTENKKEKKGAENMVEEATEVKEVKDSTATTNGGKKERRVLSDRDAAVLIQAAYRGYQVRKWEPLKKIKQIAEVSKEVTDIRGRIQALEDSSDLQNDDKQKIAIGETIMRLLLKLDTIQGLHPSFREIRKSLARDLVTLQERLDSIMAKKPQQQMQELVVQKPVEVTPQNTQNGENQQEQQEEEVAARDTFEGISDGSHNTLEKCEDQVCMKDDINNIHSNDGGSESQSSVDPASNEGAETTTELVNGDINHVVTVDALNCTNNLSETDKMDEEPETKSEVNDIPVEVDKLDMTALKELPVGVVDEEIDVPSGKDEQNEKGTKEVQSADCLDGSPLAIVDDSARDELDSVTHAMMELPVGVLDEDKATAEYEKEDETNISKGEVQSVNEGCIEELPVGLLDEDTSKSDLEKHGDTKTHEEVLPSEGEESNADESTRSSTDDNEKATQLEQPLLEEKEEVQSSGESDGWVKIEFQKEDELKGDALPYVEFGCQSAQEVGNETKFSSLTTEANGHELGNEDVCLEANDGTNMLAEPMEFVPMGDLQNKKEPEEKPAQVDGRDMVAEQVISCDGKDTETLPKEETKLSAASPALTELPVGEHDGGLNGDMKLLEENEKLRKLMKELLEAGNEQLSVISNLTGRVKDLEKKLATNKKSKRVRTKRYRPPTSKVSCM